MKRGLVVLLGAVPALLAAWAAGAVVAALLPGTVGVVVAALSSLVVVFALPLWFDWKVTKSTRRREPGAASTAHQSLAIWGALVLALLVFAMPSVTRRALEARGDWFLLRTESRAEPGVLARAVRRVTPYIPRSEPDPSLAPRVPAATARAASASPPPLPSASAPVAKREEAARASALDAVAQAGIQSASSAAALPPIARNAPVQGPAEVFRKYADSVVIVKTRVAVPEKSPFGEFYRQLGLESTEGFGSGFVVEADGVIVTNQHVVNDGAEAMVVLRDGREFGRVTRLAETRTHDLALLRIEAKGLRPMVLAADDAVEVGAPAIAIGSPLGLEYSLTTGVVSALRSRDATELIQMQTTIAPGSSGGPLLSDDGQLIGVNVSTHGAGLNYAVRVKHVRELLRAKREPHAYAEFKPALRVTNIEAQGIELGPTDRATLAEGLKLWGTGLKRCVVNAPKDPEVIYSFASGGAMTAEPAVTSNLERPVRECQSPIVRLLAMRLRVALLDGQAQAAAEGFTVSARIEGLGSAEVPVTLKLVVRFEAPKK